MSLFEGLQIQIYQAAQCFYDKIKMIINQFALFISFSSAF